MRNLIGSILLILAFHALEAQSLTPEVVASAGESVSNSSLTLEWTLGELVTETFVGTIVLTQGFHQPGLQTTTIENANSSLGPIQVYPNPSSGRITIKRERNTDLQLVVWDIQGRVLIQQQTTAMESHLDLSHVAAGIYILRLTDGKKATQSIRIEKL